MSGIRFAGYAAIFDRIDRGGDMIRPGAFARSLERSGGSLPVYWQHRPGSAVGHVTYAREDARGLCVIGDIAEGSEAAAMLARGARGLSFGYRVRQARGTAPRELTEVDIVEVSLVHTPMMPMARVHLAIKESLQIA
ncbi:HK97 family phage prohead protease [Sphingorhabdus sp. Alg239-R122]|uniref:HK97 family phage prohead protease n=1 Tax=Sphingorhabdus sp. Alg239-R122 TaxID=2305989 RepID=UPI001F0840FD|nr:HK97 family phage prohead protease [Sphingorhabdus sp. Alg239-R122]